MMRLIFRTDDGDTEDAGGIPAQVMMEFVKSAEGMMFIAPSEDGGVSHKVSFHLEIANGSVCLVGHLERND